MRRYSLKWLLTVGVLVALRLGPAKATEPASTGWGYDALLAQVEPGLPRRFARSLHRPRNRCASPDAEAGSGLGAGVWR